MANEINTPNMNLPNPVPSVAPGPEWAQDIANCLTIVDSHNHAPGSGVPINPDGININADLPFNNINNITQLRSVNFTPTSIAAAAPDLGCIYVQGVDLYYNDESGNKIQITSGGSVNSGAGSINGLPSGTASATYLPIPGTFQWQQSTSTAANMDAATLIVRYPGSYPTITGNGIAIQAPSSLSSAYALTLPALPAANNTFLTIGTTGTIASAITIDNSTLTIDTNVLEVATGGIGTTQIADGAVTSAKLAAVNNGLSSSTGLFGTFSGTPVDVTNATVTIVTTGRPVFIQLLPDSSGNASFLQSVGTTSTPLAEFRIVRDSTVISINDLGVEATPASGPNANVVVPASSISFTDLGAAAGSHTYKLQAKAGAGQAVVSFARLYVEER